MKMQDAYDAATHYAYVWRNSSTMVGVIFVKYYKNVNSFTKLLRFTISKLTFL